MMISRYTPMMITSPKQGTRQVMMHQPKGEYVKWEDVKDLVRAASEAEKLAAGIKQDAYQRSLL